MAGLLKPLGMGAGVLGAGAALHGAGLGDLLSPLDWPRQAAYNLFGAPIKAAQSGNWSDLLGAVPGLAGGALGFAVGGPVGMLAGSALGGTLQGIGNASGSEAFNAPSVRDLTGTDDFLPNLAVGLATDPLMYAGGAGTWRAGKAALQGAEKAAPLAKALTEAAPLAKVAEEAIPIAKFAEEVPLASRASIPVPKVKPSIPIPDITPSIPTAERVAEPFYSRLEQAINGLPQNSMKSESVINMLNKAKGGVAAEEIEATGLKQMLEGRKGQKVTKEELLNHFKENQIQIEEKWLTGNDVKFPDRVTPGGDKYFELVLTIPEGKPGSSYVEPHGLGKGTIAHVRGNARGDTLHIDEIQSQLHQTGKAQGYQVGPLKGKIIYEAYGPHGELLGQGGTAEEARKFAIEIGLDRAGMRSDTPLQVHAFDPRVPDAPFKDTWHELAMKRMIRYAADNDYKAITLSTGEQVKSFTQGQLAGQIKHYGTAMKPIDIGNEVLATMKAELTSADVAEAVARGDISKAQGKLYSGEMSPEAYGKTVADSPLIPGWMKKYGKQYGVKVEVGGQPEAAARMAAHDAEAERLAKEIELARDRAFNANFPNHRPPGVPPPLPWSENGDTIQQLMRQRSELLGSPVDLGPTVGPTVNANGTQIPVTQMSMTPQMRQRAFRGQPLMNIGLPLTGAGIGGLSLLDSLTGRRQ